MDKKRIKSKYWETMCNVLDGQFPKGECKERGQAIVMISYIEMMLQGWNFNDSGKPIKHQREKSPIVCPNCEEEMDLIVDIDGNKKASKCKNCNYEEPNYNN